MKKLLFIVLTSLYSSSIYAIQCHVPNEQEEYE